MPRGPNLCILPASSLTQQTYTAPLLPPFWGRLPVSSQLFPPCQLLSICWLSDCCSLILMCRLSPVCLLPSTFLLFSRCQFSLALRLSCQRWSSPTCRFFCHAGFPASASPPWHADSLASARLPWQSGSPASAGLPRCASCQLAAGFLLKLAWWFQLYWKKLDVCPLHPPHALKACLRLWDLAVAPMMLLGLPHQGKQL